MDPTIGTETENGDNQRNLEVEAESLLTNDFSAFLTVISRGEGKGGGEGACWAPVQRGSLASHNPLTPTTDFFPIKQRWEPYSMKLRLQRSFSYTITLKCSFRSFYLQESFTFRKDHLSHSDPATVNFRSAVQNLSPNISSISFSRAVSIFKKISVRQDIFIFWNYIFI